MDMHLNLFFIDDCLKSSNGFSYLHNSLISLLEHKTFSLKGRNEIQSVITFINTKLNSHGDRAQALHLLKVFLPQCSDEVFIDNCVSWMQQCVRISSTSREKEIVSLAYEVLGKLFQYSGMMQELTKPVSGSVIPKFLEHVHHVSSNFQSQTENAAYLLCCLEFVMRNYGGSCGPHKSNIEQFLMKFVDHPDKQTVRLVARCVAVLPLVGGGGVLNVSHKNSWEVLQKKLLLHLQETLDALFEGIPEVQLFQNSERTDREKLHIPVFEENDPFHRIQRLAMRFINLSFFLQELLVHELPVAKRVMPHLFINLFVRGFGVNSNTVSKHITADKLIVGCLIPKMHIAMFKLLEALIICCGQNLLEYGSLICKFVLQTLKWTSYDKHWPHGTERPYGLLRKNAYNTLTLWLKVAKAGSCVEISSPDELIDLLLGDVKISHTAVTLSAARARGRHLTKQQRKQLKLGQDTSVCSSEPSWSRTKLYDPTANHDTCAAALRTLQWILQTAGPFLKPTLHKMIQEDALKILLKIGRGEIFAPYGDWKCRLELYRLLHALVMWPHCSWPPPLQFAFQLMHVGLSDPCVKVASFCSQSLNNCVKLVHPVSRPLHLPPSVDDMQQVIQLENCHKKDIFFSETMDTDQPLSPQQGIGLLQASSSPKLVHNAPENHFPIADTSTLQNNTDDRSLETKTMHDKNLCALVSSSGVHSSHVTSCQDKSLNGDGSNDDVMDIVTDNNISLQPPPVIVKEKTYYEQNDTELENQNNHNILLHPKLLNSEYELQDKCAETVEDSCISSIHPIAKHETEEKYETVENNSLPEKLEVTGAGGENEEERGDADEEVNDENDGDINEVGDKTDDDDDDEEEEMENTLLVHKKESSVKRQVGFRVSDKAVERGFIHKAPLSPNNYSISYLYDQSSDSNDSDIETDIVTCSVSLDEIDKEKLKDVNSLEDLHIAETGADEHSQTCIINQNNNENKVVDGELHPVSAPQKLINGMCEEKRGDENILDSTSYSNITDDVSKHKVLTVDLCGVADGEDSEVDVTTIPGVPEESEKEVVEMEVVSVLDERTVKHTDSSSKIQKAHYAENEETSFMEVAKVRETITILEETKDPTEIDCDNDGNVASEVQGDQCIIGQVENGFMAHSSDKETDLVNKIDTVEHEKDIKFERQSETESCVEIPEKDLKLQDKNLGVGNEEIIEQQTSVSPKLQDKNQGVGNEEIIEQQTNVSPKLQDKNQSIGNEEIIEQQTSVSPKLQDKNQGVGNEEIIEQQTSVSPNEQESMPEIDCYSVKKDGEQTSVSPDRQESMPEIDCQLVKKEADHVCPNSVATNMFTETENIDAENLNEPLTKKRKLETSVSETE